MRHIPAATQQMPVLVPVLVLEQDFGQVNMGKFVFSLIKYKVLKTFTPRVKLQVNYTIWYFLPYKSDVGGSSEILKQPLKVPESCFVGGAQNKTRFRLN